LKLCFAATFLLSLFLNFDVQLFEREVFLLNRIEKKKYKEISEMLNISVKAVEKRMHQALLVMRKEIGNV
jgi:DNA-directed RNA polymerase specialized sigma subunit